MAERGENRYWRENVAILRVMLTIWFVVSFLLAIVLVDVLDGVRLGGIKLGFWLAQQGSIYVYVVLIFVYIHLMDRLDRKYRVDTQSLHDSHREN